MLSKAERQRLRDSVNHLAVAVQGKVCVEASDAGWLIGWVRELLDDLDAKDEEIARITALNAQQARRMVHLTVLAVGCDKHPAYRRKRPPTWQCETCKLMWEASQTLNEMAQGEVRPGG